MAPQAKYSFTIKDCRGMAKKMSRELSRFSDASRTVQDPVHMGDHAINFAWTAWHLHDWVWRLHFKGNDAAQDALVPKSHPLRTDKKANNGEPPLWFQNFLRQGCPELAYCQDITTGTKHFEISRYIPKVGDTTLSASVVQTAHQPSSSGTPTADGVIPPPNEIAPNQRAKILVGPDWLPALEEFQAVADFWNRFLDEHELA